MAYDDDAIVPSRNAMGCKLAWVPGRCASAGGAEHAAYGLISCCQ